MDENSRGGRGAAGLRAPPGVGTQWGRQAAHDIFWDGRSRSSVRSENLGKQEMTLKNLLPVPIERDTLWSSHFISK